MIIPSTAKDAAPPGSAHNIYCKFLLDREAYIPCHIRVPDESHRLSAVALDGHFYSFFKVVADPYRALMVATRLGKRDNEVVMTQTKRGYVLWVHEAQARFAPPANTPRHSLKPAFGPTACLILGQGEAFYRETFKVPDLAEPIAGIRYGGKAYSIFREEDNAAQIIETVAKLTRRGDTTLLAMTGQSLILGVYEPQAISAA